MFVVLPPISFVASVFSHAFCAAAVLGFSIDRRLEAWSKSDPEAAPS